MLTDGLRKGGTSRDVPLVQLPSLVRGHNFPDNVNQMRASLYCKIYYLCFGNIK